MHRLRLILAAIMLVSLLVGVSQSVLAGPATQFSVNVKNATIPWNIELTNACSEIPDGVSINSDPGSSSRVKHATQNVKSDGTTQIVTTDLVKGTATDNNDAAYKFVYENNTTYDLDGDIVTVAMKDTFKLKGGDVNFTTGFNWRWQYQAPDGLTVAEVTTPAPDIAVNPFVFAADNGADSWQKLSTRGDPLNCDPL